MINNLMAKKRMISIRFARFFALLVIFTAINSLAQNSTEPYLIGPADVLTITFWQEPDLNSEVRVTDNGMITIPVIGEIKAAGLTTVALAKNIIDQMAFYQTPVSQATVVVSEFNSQSVVVSGQVVNPSSRSYERIPDLWRVIIDAGGPTEQADLARVTIIRKEGNKSRVIETDLLAIIQEGDLSRAPILQPGDLINIPVSVFGTGIRIGGQSSEFEGRNVYFVLGSVVEPGARNLEKGIDVLEAITLAGGSTPSADLENVRVVMKGPRYSKVLKINLRKYINEGTPPRFILHPEDTIFVPSKQETVFKKILDRVGEFIPLITAAGTIILLTR
ncbi:MAG: polysaccharide biosynthesis/export family protein [candidate division Zixibacteria bacterium]